MGWSTADPGSATLERVSNPGGGPQAYSRTVADRTPRGTCGSLPPAYFLYENHVSGGTAGGSSGAPLWTGNTVVVGQLLGQCGSNPEDNCDPAQYVVDGRFGLTYESVGRWLGGSATTTLEAPASLAASSVKKRRVTLTWTDASSGESNFEVLEFDGVRYVSVGTVSANSTAATIRGLARRTTYRFAIRACASGECSPLAEVTVTTR
jgi:hypothetical protein